MPTVGTCSRCNGPVQTPELWGGVIPPTPTCSRCGAVASKPFGPVVPMDPPLPAQPAEPVQPQWLPIEPTPGMVTAGAIALVKASDSDLDPTREEIIATYRAMIAAAPKV